MKIEFKEAQRYNQWWLWIIMIGLGIIPIAGIYKQLILGEPFGNNPMSDLGLIIFTIFIYAVIALVVLVRLETEIDKNEIRILYFPFVKRSINWKEVKSAEIIQYRFVGYGIKRSTEYGTIYNAKGNKGLAIELHNGKKLVIGTQKEKELKEVVSKFID
jgi:hypothetical protein